MAAFMEGRELARRGEVVGGKYRVDHVIGSGGMGLVVAATHLQLKSRVAIKFLLARGKASEGPLARSLNEAQAAAAIRSVHGVRVFDVGMRADGVPFIVMELLEGETLATLLGRTGPLAITDSVDYVVEAAEALAEAHANGIVHRDLKPGNLFLARDGECARAVRVLDFGIAKSFEDDARSLRAGNEGFVGSPPYVSPEQLTDPASVDARTDVWSLAVVLYECLTGSSPFTAPSVGEICARILQRSPEAVTERRPDAPTPIGELISRCLSPQKEQRPASMLEFARALAGFGSERSARSLRVMELGAETRPEPAPLAPVTARFAPSSTTDTLDTASALDTGTWPRVDTNRAAPPVWSRLALAAAVVSGAGLLVLSLRGPFASPARSARARLAIPSVKEPAVPSPAIAGTDATAENPLSAPERLESAPEPAKPTPLPRRKPRTATAPSKPDDPEWIYLDRK